MRCFWIFLYILFPLFSISQENDSLGFFSFNGTKLYYEISGEGAPVVLIHGGWLNSSQWDVQFGLLQKNYRVMRFDMRGYGRSALGQPDSAYTNYDDLNALMEHLRMARAHIVGVSAGAQAAIDLALHYPKRVLSLVLGASPLSGFDVGKAFTEGVAGITAAGAADDLQLLHQRVWSFAPFRVAADMPLVKARLNDMIIRQHGWSAQRSGAAKPKRTQPLPATRLAEINIPLLMIVGDGEMEELKDVARYVVKNVMQGKMVMLAGAGHFPNLEQADKFNELVLVWLKERD